MRIGTSADAYICPWCGKTFSYNGCEPMSGLPAYENWFNHVRAKHRKEYDEINKGRFDINVAMDLHIGILPKERKHRTYISLKKQIEEKEQELSELKKQLEKLK